MINVSAVRAFCKRVTATQPDENEEKKSGYIRVRTGNTSRAARNVASGISPDRPAAELERVLLEILDSNREGAKRAWIEYLGTGEHAYSDACSLDLGDDEEAQDIDPTNVAAVAVSQLVNINQGLSSLLLAERELSAKLSKELVDQATSAGYLSAQAEFFEQRLELAGQNEESGYGDLAKSLVPLIAQVSAAKMRGASPSSTGEPAQEQESASTDSVVQALDCLCVALQQPDAGKMLQSPEIASRLETMFGLYMAVQE